MSFPVITVRLWRPGVYSVDATQYLSQESAPEIAARIEKPGETNSFTAADVSLKFRDSLAFTVRNLLISILPSSTDYRVDLSVDGSLVFSGVVLPNTIVVDEVENSISFTAAQDAVLLSQFGAKAQFTRIRSGTWTIQDPTVGGGVTIREASGAAIVDQFMVGDPVEVLPIRTGASTQLGTIVRIALVNPPSPANTYQLWLSATMSTYPPVGNIIQVPDESFWKRGMSVYQAVQNCYLAAGLVPPSGDRFFLATIGAEGQGAYPDLIASPLTSMGLNGQPLGVMPGIGSPLHQYPTVGTTNGAYDLFNPPAVSYGESWTQGAAWNPRPGGAVQPVSSEARGGRGYVLTGPRFTAVAFDDAYGPYGEITAYAYDYSKVSLGGNYRFKLTYIYGYDPDASANYVEWRLDRETTNDGWTWGNMTFLTGSGGRMYGPDTIRRQIYDNPRYFFPGALYTPSGMFGIGIAAIWDYSTTSNPYILFTQLSLDADGNWVWGISYYSAAGIQPLAPGIHGWLDWCGRGVTPYLCLFIPNDTLTSMTVWVWSYSSSTGLLYRGQWVAPADLKPWTLRFWNTYNAGTGLYYMYGIGASSSGGVSLYYFNEPFSDLQKAVVLAEPGQVRDWVDVATIQVSGSTTNWPITALFDGLMWWIDSTPAASIAYIDASDKTAGDILAEIAAAFSAVYYQDPQGNNYFRSRSVASSISVGSSDDPRDVGLISFRSQPIWSQNYRLITVRNSQNKVTLSDGTVISSNDATITAYYPTDASYFAGSDQELAIDNEFVRSYSHAYALARSLYSYFSNPMTTLEFERELDGRYWDVGKTFHTTVLGARAQYLIIETNRQLLSPVVRVQALRMN